MRFRNRSSAATYLNDEKGVPTTAVGLANLASRGRGPNYSIVNGRALYTEADLDAWIAEQSARPLLKRTRRDRDVAA